MRSLRSLLTSVWMGSLLWVGNARGAASLEWRQVVTTRIPSGASLAYDENRKEVLAFGGEPTSPGPRPRDVWAWNGVTWKSRLSSLAPPGRVGAAWVYDPTTRRTWLFGDSGGQLSDLWFWKGDTWSFVPAITPRQKFGVGAAFDQPTASLLLVAGGQADRATLGFSTYRFDGASWVELPNANKDALRDAAVARAHSCGATTFAVLLSNRSGEEAGRVARWDGAEWRPFGELKETGLVNTESASPLVLACDEANVPLIFLAVGTTRTQYEPHRLQSGDWPLDPSLVLDGPDLGVAYDTSRGTLVAVSGGNTYLKRAGDAGFVNPFALRPYVADAASSTFDETHKQGLIPGGVCSGTALGGVCDPRPSVVALPGARMSHRTFSRVGAFYQQSAEQPTLVGPGSSVTYARSVNAALLFGGEVLTPDGSSVTLSAAVSRWSGSKWQADVVSGTLPPPRASASFAFDRRRGRAVMFAGFNQPVTAKVGLSDGVWEYDPVTRVWARASTSLPFPVTEPMQAAYDETNEELVVLVPTAGSEYSAWSWNGMRWTPSAERVALGPGYTLAWHPQLRTLVAYGGRGGVRLFVRATGAKGTQGKWLPQIQSESPPVFAWSTAFFDAESGGMHVVGSTLPPTRPVEEWTLLTRGSACTSDVECPGAACVDGVCCLEQRCGTCETCGGDDPGRCTRVRNAEDADSCAGANACSLDGACKPNVGTSCTDGATCASGHCVDGVCCNTECDGLCEACSVETKVTGEGAGVCGPAKSTAAETCRGCATDAQCGPYRCVNQLCKSECTSIVDCSGDNECLAGRCIRPGDLQGSASCGSSAGGSTVSWGLFALALASLMRRRARTRR